MEESVLDSPLEWQVSQHVPVIQYVHIPNTVLWGFNQFFFLTGLGGIPMGLPGMAGELSTQLSRILALN